jgi:hypothetical protein
MKDDSRERGKRAASQGELVLPVEMQSVRITKKSTSKDADIISAPPSSSGPVKLRLERPRTSVSTHLATTGDGSADRGSTVVRKDFLWDDEFIDNFGASKLLEAYRKLSNSDNTESPHHRPCSASIPTVDGLVNPDRAKQRRLMLQRVMLGGLDATPLPPDFFNVYDPHQGSLKLRRKKYNIISGQWM